MLHQSAQQATAELVEQEAPAASLDWLVWALGTPDGGPPNIAEHLSQEKLAEIGAKVIDEYEVDVQSRSKWWKRTEAALVLATQDPEEKTRKGWDQPANVVYPLITTAAMQFAARAYGAIVAGRDVAKGQVVGSDEGQPAMVPDPMTGQPVPAVDQEGNVLQWRVPPGAKQARADRIGKHLSWQLTDEMEEWEEETDRLLHILPIVGVCFRKVYWSRELQRNCSHLVTPDKLVVNYWAKSLETAPRITEEIKLYPLEITERVRSGAFFVRKDALGKAEPPFGRPQDAANDDDAPHLFLEQHRRWDLDEDGYPEPYIVTVHKETSTVVRITACWEQEGVKLDPGTGRVLRVEPVRYYVKYGFIPAPDGSFYEIGFGTLLKPHNETINTTLNQLFDAGTRQNLGGGFIGGGIDVGDDRQGGVVRFGVGVYKRVRTTGQDLRANIVDLPHPGPSPVLFQLLGVLIDSGKDIAAVKDVLTGDMPQANTPATTTLAMIEQGLKVFTAIYKRIHRGLKRELGLLRDLNRRYLDPEVYFRVLDEQMAVTLDDYRADDYDVVPVSDPSIVTDMQQMGRAGFLQSMIETGLVDPVEATTRILRAAKIENPDKLLPQPKGPSPVEQLQLEMAHERHTAELDEINARTVLLKAQAVKAIADAEKAEAGLQIDWYRAQVDLLKARMQGAKADGADKGTGGSGGRVAKGAGGGSVPKLPAGPPPPGNGALGAGQPLVGVGPANAAVAAGPVLAALGAGGPLG